MALPVSAWSHIEICRHLNNFLFRKNEEVNSIVVQLLGGKEARLTLAQIATKILKLLILDAVINNFDLERKKHVVQVLKTDFRAVMITSHDTDFLNEMGDL